MKTSFLHLAIFLISFSSLNLMAQTPVKKSMAVISIDTRNMQLDAATICNMVQLELEKTNTYEILDKYDVSDLIKKNGIDVTASYGKNSLVKIGKLLNADKMITGSVEKLGDKIIFILRLIDVKSETIEKTDVMEYLNQQEQFQIMVRISVNNLLGLQNDKLLVDLLVNYDQPITSSKTTLKLNGPRVGAVYSFGRTAERLRYSSNDGGFNLYPVNCMIGYQFEKQYLSSGDFQALFEVIPTVSNMESGIITPSLNLMLGFRFNKSGFEFGLGPVFRVVPMAKGYYENGEWILYDEINTPANIKPIEEIDSRGMYQFEANMVFAVGKTFRSGYLNLPVNFYYSPRPGMNVIGFSVGFNVAKKAKFEKK